MIACVRSRARNLRISICVRAPATFSEMRSRTDVERLQRLRLHRLELEDLVAARRADRLRDLARLHLVDHRCSCGDMSSCENGPMRPPLAFDGESDTRRRASRSPPLQHARPRRRDLLLASSSRATLTLPPVRRHLDEDLAQRDAPESVKSFGCARSTAAPLPR
jgi:hypothetical protein